jgi:hypothetical protein
MDKEWIRDKYYYRKKYNTEKQEHKYTKSVMIETINRVIEENQLLKSENEYLKQTINRNRDRIKQKIERIKELESHKKRVTRY